MTVPLPGGMADELMWHLDNCSICKLARLFGDGYYCERGKQLVRLTTDERHGPK